MMSIWLEACRRVTLVGVLLVAAVGFADADVGPSSNRSNRSNQSNQSGWSFTIVGKRLRLGMSLVEAHAAFPNVQPDDVHPPRADYTTLIVSIPEGSLWLSFRDARLVSVLIQGGTEGQTAVQASLEAQVVRKYGKGRARGNVRTWLVDGGTVTEDCWPPSSDTGDCGCQYTIERK